MYRHLSTGDMYDPRRGLYISIDKDKPSPQNRQQIELTRLRIQKLVDLQDDELDYLMSESRRLLRLPLKSLEYEPWYIKNKSQIHREYFVRGLQHEYYWKWYMTTHMKYTREQLDAMPYHERQTKKHERLTPPEFWNWVETSLPLQYHALWGKRKTLPGVARSLERRYNRKITNKQRIKNVTSTKRSRPQKISRTRIVTQTEPTRGLSKVSKLSKQRGRRRAS